MNGVNYLLDTNIIIGFLQRSQAALDLFQARKIRIRECAYSSITRMELLIFSSLSGTEKQSIELLLNLMTYFAINQAVEDAAIAFRHQYQTKLPDAIIAATAGCYQLELLTLDKKLASKL
jgi:predicted nucleic acid-binding protein